MGPTFKVQVYRRQQLAYSGEVGGALEMGRQQRSDEPLFVEQLSPGGRRVVIARIEESTISRMHLRIEPLSNDHFRATNLSNHNVVQFEGGANPAPTGSGEYRMPALLRIGDAAIRVEPTVESDPEFEMLSRPTLLPNRGSSLGSQGSPLLRVDGASAVVPIRSLLADAQPGPRTMPLPAQAPEALIAWLQTVIEVLQSAASSTDFFARAAAAVVELVGLDSGCVLLAEGAHWRTSAQFFGPRLRGSSAAVRPSARILERMKQEKRTFWNSPSAAGALPISGSLVNVQAVVVAPILDPRGEVIGALYGDRRLGLTGSSGAAISKLEAMIVETLACGVAAGLARLDQERQALAARVQFEQFFTPELAHQLTIEPDLLKGRDTEVTLLFSDIRGFSRISDRLGPAGTVEWIGDVMEVLSEFVSRHGGVLVDYIGDELLAMWGAPLPQPDHPQRACRAALEMWRAIPEMNRRWAAKLGEQFSLGIGINSGIARVGNTGSQRKFKYGPLGPTVNVASRVQGATRYLKTGVIVTAATQERLGGEFFTRRLCKARVVNIPHTIELFELQVDSDPAWAAFCKDYEQALSQFENQDFEGAAAALGELLIAHPDDGPTHVLLSRTASLAVDPDVEFNVVWELPGK